MMSFTDILMEFDLNNMTHEWMFISFLCFAICVGLAIAWVSKFKEAEKLRDDLELQLANIEGLKKALEDKQRHEIDILKTIAVNTEKITALEAENGRYKDARDMSVAFLDKYVVPVNSIVVANMNEGTYAYFVDEDKKREFALHSAKKQIIDNIVDLMVHDNYIWWENTYDEATQKYTVRGKLLILADKNFVDVPTAMRGE